MLQAGNFCWVGGVSGFCALLFSSSLFTGYVLLICELPVSRNFSATWLFVVWLSPPSVFHIYTCMQVSIPLQLLRLCSQLLSRFYWQPPGRKHQLLAVHMQAHNHALNLSKALRKFPPMAIMVRSTLSFRQEPTSLPSQYSCHKG